MRGNEAGTSYRRDETSYYIEFWKQPFLYWLVAWLYHYLWEDGTDWFVVRLSDWLHARHNKAQPEPEEEEFDDYIPLTNRRDLRCYDLHQKKRVILTIIYITQEQFDILVGTPPEKKEKPRHEIAEPMKPPSEDEEA